MPSVFARSLEPRERRTIAIGAMVVAAASVIVLGVIPVSRAWMEREALITALRDRVARLEAVADGEPGFAAAAMALDQQLDAGGVRVVRARSLALAASTIQGLVREYAEASAITVTRLDAAGAPLTDSGTLALPTTLSAQGDIYGVADFLRRVQSGPWLLEVASLTITPNPVLRGNVLQVALELRVPIAVDE